MVEIIATELISALGNNLNDNYASIKAGQTGFRPVTRFSGIAPMPMAATMEISGVPEQSFPETMLRFLRANISELPSNAELFFATTVGEIDLLERDNSTNFCTCRSLMDKAVRIFGATRGYLVSAACSSGNFALGMARQRIEANLLDYAIVIGCDMVSEFVYSGFRSIGALDEQPCRPYNKDRGGVSLGEAAGIMVLASSKKFKGKSLGRLSGFGASCDATHITAPAISGDGLATAIRQAVNGDIGAILGHGTGTIFNDQAEINAINKVFGDSSIPMVSLKANLGHTLGAAGIVQAIIALKMLNDRQIPPQVGLSDPMTGAEKLVSKDIQKFENGRILSLTLGFGGLNSAVLLEDC